jgi:hypothetical protein
MTATGGVPQQEQLGRQQVPPATPVNSTPGPSLPQLVQNVALSGAMLYVVGLLTTNAYLYGLGVADFSLLRARFVLTGFVALLPLTIALLGGLYAADELAAPGRASGTARVGRQLIRHVALPCGLFFLLFFAFFWYAAANDPWPAARVAAQLSVACALAVMVLLGGLALYQVTDHAPAGQFRPHARSRIFGQLTGWFGLPGPVTETLALAVAGPLIVLTYLGWFGHHIYPAVPEQLGGGQPRAVRLLIASEAIPAAGQLGLGVSQSAPVTPLLELLWEGDDSYIVRVPGPQEPAIVQFASDLVDGLIPRTPGSEGAG